MIAIFNGIIFTYPFLHILSIYPKIIYNIPFSWQQAKGRPKQNGLKKNLLMSFHQKKTSMLIETIIFRCGKGRTTTQLCVLLPGYPVLCTFTLLSQ